MQSCAHYHRSHRFFISALTAASLVLSLSACVSSHHNLTKDDISAQADLVNPPKLINDPSNAKQLAWDRPSAFGPVPAEQQKIGQKTCEKLGKDIVALGYNPKAIDPNGVQIKGGGFICAHK